MIRCYWKDCSESQSREGEAFRLNYPYIPFNTRCRIKCDGHNTQCEFYELRWLDDIQEELMEDSRLEDVFN